MTKKNKTLSHVEDAAKYSQEWLGHPSNTGVFIPTSSGVKDEPPVSVMRLMSLVGLIAGIVVALLGMALDKDLSQLAFLASVFVVPAFTGKAVQKHIETRSTK